MDLRREAHAYLFGRLDADIVRLRVNEEGAKQATKLYETFAGRFSFKPLTLLMPNVHEQITDGLLDDDIPTEELINLWVFDYVVGLSTHMDGLVKDGYNQLVSTLQDACHRYLSSGCVPEGIRERASVDALDNPLVVVFFLMYDVVLHYNEVVLENVSKAAHTPRA